MFCAIGSNDFLLRISIAEQKKTCKTIKWLKKRQCEWGITSCLWRWDIIEQGIYFNLMQISFYYLRTSLFYFLLDDYKFASSLQDRGSLVEWLQNTEIWITITWELVYPPSLTSQPNKILSPPFASLPLGILYFFRISIQYYLPLNRFCIPVWYLLCYFGAYCWKYDFKESMVCIL
jgi:hypothetical protein